MIAHVVLFQPRAPLSLVEERALLASIRETVARLESVRAARVGRRVRHGLPGYEQAMRDDYEFALILEFEDVAGLRAYLTHPDHAPLGDLFTTGAAGALAYDYELLPLDAAEARA